MPTAVERVPRVRGQRDMSSSKLTLVPKAKLSPLLRRSTDDDRVQRDEQTIASCPAAAAREMVMVVGGAIIK